MSPCYDHAASWQAISNAPIPTICSRTTKKIKGNHPHIALIGKNGFVLFGGGLQQKVDPWLAAALPAAGAGMDTGGRDRHSLSKSRPGSALFLSPDPYSKTPAANLPNKFLPSKWGGVSRSCALNPAPKTPKPLNPKNPKPYNP